MYSSDEIDDAFAAAWKRLIACKEIVCAKGELFPAIFKPQAVILDVSVARTCMLPSLDSCALLQHMHRKPTQDVRAISGHDVKIYTFHPIQLCALWRLFGPEHLGGRGNMRLKIEQEAARTGRPVAEVRLEV